MKKYNIILVALVVLIAACTPPKTDLEKKRKELADVNAKIDELKAKAKGLETEIAKLDTSAAGILKNKTVKVEDVTPSEFDNFIEVQGMVDSDENVMVNTTQPGIITAINVKEGDVVRKGQILATTDASVLNKSIDQLQTNLDLATIAYDKQKRLWDQKIGSEIQYLSAKTQKESLEKQLKTLQSQIDLTVIKSPINGVVDEVKVKIGEMATPGFTGIRVVNLNNIKVIAKVSDNYISKVKKGQSVIVRFPDANYELTAPVSFVSSVIGTNRSFTVEVKVNNKDGRLKPNMVASLLISDQKLANVLVVPSNAIEHTATGNYLMVVAGTKGNYTASRRKVEIGVEYNGRTIVTEGLKEGEKIITFGFQDVVDGQPISF
jgi:membrane fusion protein (multidrug efflux system)